MTATVDEPHPDREPAWLRHGHVDLISEIAPQTLEVFLSILRQQNRRRHLHGQGITAPGAIS